MTCVGIDGGFTVKSVDVFCCLGDMLVVNGDVDASVTATIHSVWFKF